MQGGKKGAVDINRRISMNMNDMKLISIYIVLSAAYFHFIELFK